MKSGAHVPIIAMTAHAMTGDTDAFLESRMDGYVSKPIHVELLRDDMETLTDERFAKESEPMKKNEESPLVPVWNQADVLERVDHDQELLRELLVIFKEDFPRSLRSLEEAVAAGDLKNSASLSHALRGMLANLGGARAAAAAAKLEKMASSPGESASLNDALNALQQEVASLVPELDAYLMEVRR